MTEEKIRLTLSWWRRLNRKLESKPKPLQILQKRTMNTALAVLDNIEDIPFSKLSMSLYFYCQDLRMNEFTHFYENQVELAGANPERFVFQLHKFFNDITNKIKKDDLYPEFFEFYYRCNKIRLTNKDEKIEYNVILAYLNLLTQTIEYLRPSKYDFNTIIAGRTTTGELMTVKDLFPLLDAAGYDFESDFEKGKIKGNPQAALLEAHKKYGFDLKTQEDLQIISNVDKIQTTTISAMLPFINEYTFDILPRKPFTTKATTFDLLKTEYSVEDIQGKLTKRKRTLPVNGAVIKFKENPVFEEILLKEVYFDDGIFLLYNFKTFEGNMVGFYDTKGKFFFTVLQEYWDNKEIAKKFTSLVLYLYGCYTLNDPNIQIPKVGEYFKVFTRSLEAEGFSQGGKLQNKYNPDKEEKVGVSRKDSEKYTHESKAIQGYIRKLPIGQQASEKAILLAESLGYDLDTDETYVQPFIKQVFKLKYKTE